MKSTAPGQIVGYALGAYDAEDTSKVGKVEVFVNPGFDYRMQSQASIYALNGGDAMFASLNVEGDTTLESLTVTGDASFEGEVTVHKLTVETNLYVNGHIVSSGDQPQVEAGEGLGEDEVDPTGNTPDTELTKVAAKVDGTDSAGTIWLESGLSAAKGKLVDITFSQPYESAPRIVVSARNETGASIRIYSKPKPDGSGFELFTLDTPTSDKTYVFDYVIIATNPTELTQNQ